MGNTNEGVQPGKDPENEPSEAGDSLQNVGSSSNDGSPEESGCVVGVVAFGGDGVENAAEQLDSKLESTIKPDLVTGEELEYLDAGLRTSVAKSPRNSTYEEFVEHGSADVGISEAGNVRERVLESRSKTLSNGDEEDLSDRPEFALVAERLETESVFPNSDKAYRDSSASTMTDVSEMYQTAGEDSENEAGYNEEDDDVDDDDDVLRKTLCALQLQENIGDAVSIGYISLTVEDGMREMYEKEPHVELGNLVESEETSCIIKDLIQKPVSTVIDKDTVEVETLNNSPKIAADHEELLNNVSEDVTVESQRVISVNKGRADDVSWKVGNVVEGFGDVTGNRIDTENSELKDLIDFESRDPIDASELDDGRFALLKVSSVVLHLTSPVQNGNPEARFVDPEQDTATGHTEQFLNDRELPAENDSGLYRELETGDIDSEAEETSTTRLTDLAGNDASYDATDGRGHVTDAPSSTQLIDHGVSSDAGCDYLHEGSALVLNAAGNDFRLESTESQGNDEGHMRCGLMEDGLVGRREVAADCIHPFSSSLEIGPLEQKEVVDTFRSHSIVSTGAIGLGSNERDSGSPGFTAPLSPDKELPVSTLHSLEHDEQYSLTLPAEDSLRFPSAHETPFESKSYEIFISNAREQGSRTKTTNDEEPSAELMTFDSDVDLDASRRILETLSTGVGSEENEEQYVARGVSDLRSSGLVSTATVDNEDQAGGTASAAENQSWSGGEEEPEPDYSLSSDDDQADDARPDMKDLIGFSLSQNPDADAGDDASPPDYLDTVKLTELQSEMSTDSASAADNDGQSAEQILEKDETAAEDFDSWEDDDEDSMPLGNFQRISSIRPSRRGPIRSKRSVVIPPSCSEHPEEEGDFDAQTPGAESVFLPFSTGSLTIPHPSRFDRAGPLSVPVLTKGHEQELWTKSPQDATRSMTTRSDGSQFNRSRFQHLERRNATRSVKAEAPSDEREWTKYDVVLRKNQGGFGITLSHSNPVIVQKVLDDGVAAKSGVREGDRIHKVNGTLVSNCSHEEVISMIRSSGLHVVLVLLRPSSETRDQPVPPTPSITENPRLSGLSKSSSSPSTRSLSGISLTGRMSSPPEVPEVSYDAIPKPFADLNLLKQKPAHLAVFLSYLLTEGKPNAMLFTLIADYYLSSYKESNNSARRWAYEIYSTFLMSSAPLKLTVDERMEVAVQKILQKAETNGLSSLFAPIANLVRKEIMFQLKQFVVAWKSAERNNSAADHNLRSMNLDRQLEFQMIEGALWKHFEHCLLEERNDAKHAVAYSLATFFRQVGYGGAKNSNLLENCPTFMSKDKKALKNKMKKHFAHKGHQFSPRQFAAVTQCQLCQKVIWGLGHQAYHCTSCDLSIHRYCTEKIIDFCSKNRDSKRSVRDMFPGRRPQHITVSQELQKSFFLPPFMSDPDDLRNLTTPVERSNGPELLLPEFTTELGSRSPYCSYSRPFYSSDDSDLEVDSELPQLSDFIPKEELRQMKDKEKKRQQIINELFHTERNHIRALKVIDRVFFRPMQEESYIDQEFINLLFPNLQDLIQIHNSLKKSFFAMRKEKAVVDEVGLLLINWFSGPQGEKFKLAAATFCADQAYALNALRARQKKDSRLMNFLQEAATNHLCKRQELKDFLPREMQRLARYPLLIDSLRKHTLANTEEHGHLTRALELSKALLEHVNQVVKSVQNQRHLADLQSRIDWRSSGDISSLGEYKYLNLTKHLLVYDGEVTWRPYRSRPIELHMVLFEDILVLLQKQDDRLVLRCQMTTVEDTKFPYTPVLQLNSLMIRDVATDKRAFFVVDSVSPQVYDLLAHSREGKNKWCNQIQETIKRYTGVHGPFKGARMRSPTEVIDLVSFTKSERSELPPNQANDARSASCHGLSYDSPDRATSGINVQQVIGHLTTGESCDATKPGNEDECDNVDYGNKDDCGNVVEAPRSQAAAFELARQLEELILCINQMMREKLKLASDDPNAFPGDEDGGPFQMREVHTLDAKELVRTALSYVNNLMDLVNDQLGNAVASPSSDLSVAGEKRIAIPAEDLLNISSTLQHLTAQLAMRVTMDDAELERLEEEFRVTLDDLREKSSAILLAPSGDIHPNDLAGSTSCADVSASASEGAFSSSSAAGQTDIYTIFPEDQLASYDYHDQTDNYNSDLPTDENRTSDLVDGV